MDAHVSGRVVGRALEEAGHDVRAMDAEQRLEGLEDEEVLGLAISEGRVLVTADVADFPPLIARMNEAGDHHAGCILVPKSVRHEDFGTLIFGIGRALEGITQEEWTNRVRWIQKEPGSA